MSKKTLFNAANPLHWLAYLIVTIIVIVTIPILLPFAIYEFFTRDLPMLRAMEETHYWLTWKDVKKISGLDTKKVLGGLYDNSGDGEFLECRLRNGTDLARLNRLTGLSVPVASRPIIHQKVIFYEFRVNGNGPRKRTPFRVRLLRPHFGNSVPA